MIEVKNLTKNYGAIPAVKDVSFTVEAGKIYGFLGPNGAGKSTTMNMITGCLAPSFGDVKINGLDIYEDAVEAKRSIGYLPEIPPLYTDMTPFEYLEFVGRAKGLKKGSLYDEIERVMEKTKILDVSSRLIRNLSKGYRQRVGIAQAILGDPEYIILDEPTVGLDPLQIIEIRDLIASLAENHAVILSSHILQEISAVCDHVIMISKGKVVASDSMENLLKNGETLEEVFIRLAGESLDAGAAWAAANKKPEKPEKRGKKVIVDDAERGAAYYAEVYEDADEEPVSDGEDYKPMFSADETEENDDKKDGDE